MARVQHPQPQVGIVTDRLGGIEFTDGVAEVDLSDKPNLRAAYLQHGYSITEPLNVVDLTGRAPFEATVTVTRSRKKV